MVTTSDEGKGLVKVFWGDIRHKVSKIDSIFTQIIDKLSPDKTFPIYLAYYPYGAIIADHQHFYLPNNSKGIFKLDDKNVPKDLIRHLGYGKDSIPFGMVLDKNIEFFVDFKEEFISMPWFIYQPGSFFPSSRILSKKNHHIYSSNSTLTVTSGMRSTFMLPNIGCATHHSNLQRDFNLQLPPPKSLYAHWNIFKELVNSDVINSAWRSCLMYFSEKWAEKLHEDKSWQELKLYLHERAWEFTEYSRNNTHYDAAFSIIQKKRNLKPNPYLADTAKHLFATAAGAAPGYIPAIDNNAMPLDDLQKIFIESYGLKKYIPTILHPAKFNFEKDKLPIYYSLQNPSTYVFSPKSRKIINTLLELRELDHIMKIFTNDLSKGTDFCSNTIINKVAETIEFKYFHNEPDRHHVITPSSEIPNFDHRFYKINAGIKLPDATFSSDAKFLRGCISLRKKAD